MSSQSRQSQQANNDAVLNERFGHWPALSRFYGFSLVELARMPRAFMRLYYDQMAPLRAQEQLAAIQVASYPHLDKDYKRNEMTRKLEEIANRLVSVEPPKPESDEAYLMQVASAGVAIEFVDADGEVVS